MNWVQILDEGAPGTHEAIGVIVGRTLDGMFVIKIGEDSQGQALIRVVGHNNLRPLPAECVTEVPGYPLRFALASAIVLPFSRSVH